MFVKFSTLAVIAAAEPMVQVALAPPADASASAFVAAEAKAEDQGMAKIQAAMKVALATAQRKIDAALHGSFLKSEPIYIRVADGPESLSTGGAAGVEFMRAGMESKTIAASAAEFDSLTDAVVSEIRKSRHSSFLKQDVKVAASGLAWPSTLALLRGTEFARDASERAFNGKVQALQSDYLSQLNGMIAKSMGTSFLQGYLHPAVARIMSGSNGDLDRKTQSALVFVHQHSSFLKKDDMSNDVAAAVSNDNMRASAFILTHMAVKKALHAGGCPRSYEGCPVGFRAGAGGCAPGASYNGFCGARSFDGMSADAKQAWAAKCGAGWPCA